MIIRTNRGFWMKFKQWEGGDTKFQKRKGICHAFAPKMPTRWHVSYLLPQWYRALPTPTPPSISLHTTRPRGGVQRTQTAEVHHPGRSRLRRRLQQPGASKGMQGCLLGVDLNTLQGTSHLVEWLQSTYNCGTYLYIDSYTYIHTYIHSFIHSYIHTFIHSYIHTFIYIYIHNNWAVMCLLVTCWLGRTSK